MSLTAAELQHLYSQPGLEAYKPQAVLAHLADGSVVTALCYNLPVLQTIVQVILGITSLLLTLLILLHRGRGGGLSDMFGGGTTSNLGASGVAERNLNRITVILALLWVASIVVLGLIVKFSA